MTDHVIEIRKLWTVFQSGDKQAVVHKDLDLTVERGEVVSLVGGSGTGKTVLLRQILGLQTPTRGEITVLGKPAAELGLVLIVPAPGHYEPSGTAQNSS